MHRVVLFDGDCKLCNKTVDFVVRRDPKKYFQFASLQSQIAQQLLRTVSASAQKVGTESIFLIEGDRCYTKSTAALRIARKLRFPWNLLYGGIIVPRVIRDVVYDFVGRNRKRWFGTTNTCSARESEVEKDRFLD